MNKKYFFFDIDGTITDPKTRKVVPSAIETFKKLQANGHFVALCTGRANYYAKNVLHEVGLTNMVCYCGVGLVVDDKLVKMLPLPKDDVKEIVDQCNKNNIGYLLSIDDTADAYTTNNLFSSTILNDPHGFNVIVDKDFDIESKDIYKAFVAVKKGEEEKVSSIYKIGFLRINENYGIVQYDKKREGIEDMIEYLHGDIHDVVTFGDDTNDIVMCDPRWTSIAMGNGAQALKEKATYVTDTSVNDGIKKACEHFGWI